MDIMSPFKRNYLSFFCIMCMLFVSASQNPDLRSSVSSGNDVYINQTIVIICTTRGSFYLAWHSIEYIGRGQQLILNSTLAPGYSSTSIMGAVATVVRTRDGNGDLSLQSKLEISVSSHFSRSSVTCENVDLGTSDSVSWNTRDQPATQLNQSRPNIQACEGQSLHFVCLARDTSTIQWIIRRMANSDDKVNCTTSGRVTSNSTQLQALGTRIRQSFINGTLELVCSLNIVATTQQSVTCLNSEIGVNKTISFQIQGSCGSDSIQMPTTSGNDATVTASDNEIAMDKDVEDSVSPIPTWSIAIIAPIAVSAVTTVTITLAIILAMFYIRRAKKRRVKDEAVKPPHDGDDKKEEEHLPGSPASNDTVLSFIN